MKKEYNHNGRRIVGFLVRDAEGAEFREYLSDKKGGNVHEPSDGMREILARFPDQVQDKRESFGAIYLDARRKVIGAEIISTGTLDSALVHPREVFAPALALRASALMVWHNHPSGDATPSPEDIALTSRLNKAAHIMGLSLLDHLVITAEGACSSIRLMQSEGKLPVEVF